MHAIKLDEKTAEVEIGKAITRSRYVKYNVIKRVFDIILSVIMLALAAPIIVLCTIVVRLSSKGPPLCSQRRLGCRGRVFTIHKIRTTYPDGERSSEAVWSGPGDPRVTPAGRIFRCRHLDELPQLVNILIGDMSLIGPRPERPEIAAGVQLALPDYARRREIRPGLTGLAQVLQDPDVDLQSVRRKVSYDLF
jgi:lipopolysaccharide/colanic/teichoic acid biosynthesis glycosyltransferase